MLHTRLRKALAVLNDLYGGVCINAQSWVFFLLKVYISLFMLIFVYVMTINFSKLFMPTFLLHRGISSFSNILPLAPIAIILCSLILHPSSNILKIAPLTRWVDMSSIRHRQAIPKQLWQYDTILYSYWSHSNAISTITIFIIIFIIIRRLFGRSRIA